VAAIKIHTDCPGTADCAGTADYGETGEWAQLDFQSIQQSNYFGHLSICFDNKNLVNSFEFVCFFEEIKEKFVGFFVSWSAMKHHGGPWRVMENHGGP
jgi:hypothetical protein